jgi:hypothetical protein
MAESALKKNCQCPLAAGLKVFDGMVQRTIEREREEGGRDKESVREREEGKGGRKREGGREGERERIG